MTTLSISRVSVTPPAHFETANSSPVDPFSAEQLAHQSTITPHSCGSCTMFFGQLIGSLFPFGHHKLFLPDLPRPPFIAPLASRSPRVFRQSSRVREECLTDDLVSA